MREPGGANAFLGGANAPTRPPLNAALCTYVADLPVVTNRRTRRNDRGVFKLIFLPVFTGVVKIFLLGAVFIACSTQEITL